MATRQARQESQQRRLKGVPEAAAVTAAATAAAAVVAAPAPRPPPGGKRMPQRRSPRRVPAEGMQHNGYATSPTRTNHASTAPCFCIPPWHPTQVAYLTTQPQLHWLPFHLHNHPP